MSKRPVVPVIRFAIAALLASCGGAGVTVGPSASLAESPGTPVAVTLHEFSIEANPNTVEAGAVTFQIANSGAIEHSLAARLSTWKKWARRANWARSLPVRARPSTRHWPPAVTCSSATLRRTTRQACASHSPCSEAPAGSRPRELSRFGPRLPVPDDERDQEAQEQRDLVGHAPDADRLDDEHLEVQEVAIKDHADE